MTPETFDSPGTAQERARRRTMLRILPYLALLFMIAYLDRVNVGYAALDMTGDLGFGPEVYGFGAGIFFIGYFLLEIPGGLAVERWSARRWLARIMVSWGLLAILTGFIQTSTQFYVVRFLLGAAEAGFFPAIIVYLSHWFRAEDRAKATALFMAAIPITNIFGAPLSGYILGLDWLGMAGWRWMFILEGAPAVVLGIVTLFYLTDRPHQAKWLAEDERAWIAETLERESLLKRDAHGRAFWRALMQREVVTLAGAYFLIVTSVYGLAFWLPTFVKKASGSSNMTVTLISAIPYCVGLVSILAMGWSSDRTRERRWHTAAAMIAGGVGLLLSAALQDSVGLSVAMFCVAVAGLNGYLPSFWALPSLFLTGSAAAASVGLINSIGNLGGFVGPFVVGYVNRLTDSFVGGIVYLSVSAFAAALLVLSLKVRRAPVETDAVARAVATGSAAGR